MHNEDGMLSTHRLDQTLGHPRILVIGDTMLDRYTWGHAERVSPEAPVLVLNVDERDVRLGGAGSVAVLLKALEADVTLASVIGDDHDGRTLRGLVDEAGVGSSSLLVDSSRPTTVKERFLGRADQRQPHQILRVDSESRAPIDDAMIDRLMKTLASLVIAHDAVLISDYAKGVCARRLMQELISVCRSARIPVLVDPGRGIDFENYRGATLIKPNRLEAEVAVGSRIRSPDEAIKAAEILRRRYHIDIVCVTLDRDGLVIADADTSAHHAVTALEICDITGAGDTVLATLGLCLAAAKCSGNAPGLSTICALANVAAGLQVACPGVTPVLRSELLREFVRAGSHCPATEGPAAETVQSNGGSSTKLISLDAATRIAAGRRRAGRTVAFTNGCFDLLHIGHVSMLEQAAKHGDILFVAINDDASVRRLKGPTRPVIPALDRARMLAALECVDYVLIFDDPTPRRMLEAILPDVLVKGGTTTSVVGREIVEACGGRIVLTSAVSGVSTTTLVSQVRFRRLSTTYEVRGMATRKTSYDNATVGAGSVVNDCQFVYNSFSQLIADYQSHSGAVNTAVTPRVQYGYANGSANTIRSTTLTYPNGRVLNFNYGTSGGINDSLSRTDSLIDNDGTTHLADYSYVGKAATVIVSYAQPSVEYILASLTGTNDPDTGDIYTGWDRFGRAKDCRWYNFAGSADVARLKYGYDRASNRLWRQDIVAQSLGKSFDEFYSYDGLYRLKDMQRGTLNGSMTGITSPIFEQCWSLDSTNNWYEFRESATGGNWTIVQARKHNVVNEITNITNSVGMSWAIPVYDAAGNSTTTLQPGAPGSAYTAVYDAWNRLISISSSGISVQENQYDARNFRTLRLQYISGTLAETRHFYYTNDWQCIEERLSASSNPERQQVWGPRYVDDLILRDRDTTGGGTLNERLYGLQDPNWNTVALIDVTAAAQERYYYSQFGSPTFLNSTMSSVFSASTVDSSFLFTGQRFDSLTQYYLFRQRYVDSKTGRFISRDPLGYPDGYNMYAAWFVPSFVDPAGLLGIDWDDHPRFHRSCIFTMDSNPADCARWDIECRRLQRRMRLRGWGDSYYRQVNSPASIIRRVLQNRCCDVRFVGHQGGRLTNGGIVTYLSDGSPFVILPDAAFEGRLRMAFKANSCTCCQIYIYSCGGNDPLTPATCTAIANRTGCTVFKATTPRGEIFTIGRCPGQRWYSLDPCAVERDFSDDASTCGGAVRLDEYPPAP